MMTIVFIKNLRKRIQIPDRNKPLLFHLQTNYVDWMHACGGKGRCTTCKAEILAGHHNLSGLTSAEHRYRNKGLLREGERLACQMLVNGDLVIRVPEETHLPHLRYDDSPDASDSENSTS